MYKESNWHSRTLGIRQYHIAGALLDYQNPHRVGQYPPALPVTTSTAEWRVVYLGHMPVGQQQNTRITHVDELRDFFHSKCPLMITM
jgi:hypothetical protein